ncbi:MAG: hypothetical protein AAF439_11000 [Pseudomonadota bacterium]
MFQNTQPCEIGYCLADPAGGFAFQPPRTVFSQREKPPGLRSIQNCPAVNALERQMVEMPSPIGIRITLTEEAGQPTVNVNPTGTFVQPEAIGEMLAMEPPDRWRHPKKPLMKLKLPFFFVTDVACVVSQIPPFLGLEMRRWPGTMVATRYPLTYWPQSLTWMLEWDQPEGELSLKQGEPLCYFLFEFNRPEMRPSLTEAALTPELDEFRQGMEGLDHLTPDIEDVVEMAKSRRPARLMFPLSEYEG